MQECSDQEEEQEGVTRITANTSCTGIVRVETDEPATSDEVRYGDAGGTALIT